MPRASFSCDVEFEKAMERGGLRFGSDDVHESFRHVSSAYGTLIDVALTIRDMLGALEDRNTLRSDRRPEWPRRRLAHAPVALDSRRRRVRRCPAFGWGNVAFGRV